MSASARNGPTKRRTENKHPGWFYTPTKYMFPFPVQAFVFFTFITKFYRHVNPENVRTAWHTYMVFIKISY